MLTTEPQIHQAIASQPRPQKPLRVGHLPAEFARALNGDRIAFMVIIRVKWEREVGRLGCPSLPAGAGPPPRGRGSESSKHVLRVRELRDPPGGDERGDLDLVDAGLAEEADEAGLFRRRDHSRLVLEAVARGDISDAYKIRHGAGSEDTSGRWSLCRRRSMVRRVKEYRGGRRRFVPHAV
jgi:hypothetical protein